jgi:hypothetical protein
MNTAFILMARYGPRAVIPVDLICRDYFSHLTPEMLIRKVSAGEIVLPLVRIEASARCAKGVGLMDLASYLDRQMEAARKACDQLTGSWGWPHSPSTRIDYSPGVNQYNLSLQELS